MYLNLQPILNLLKLDLLNHTDSGRMYAQPTYFCKIQLIYICLQIYFRKGQKFSPRTSKCKNLGGGRPTDPSFLLKLSMTVQINHKKLYYNYYTSDKFLTLKFKFQVKSSDMPAPQLQMLRHVPDGCISKPISVLRCPQSALLNGYMHEITYSLFLIFQRQVCDLISPAKKQQFQKLKKTYDL